MSLTKSLLTLAIPVVLLIVLGAGIAYWADEDPTRRIAIFGAAVAFGSLIVNYLKTAYDLWDKERERKKKDGEGKERIKATVLLKRTYFKNGPSFHIGVTLYNEGNRPVNIKRVCLKFDGGEIPLLANESLRQLGILCIDESELNRKLEPKDHHDFHVHRDNINHPDDIAIIRGEVQVTIVAESHEGEVAQISTDTIVDALRKGLAEVAEEIKRQRG
jgi:hypothetical protein